MKKSSCQAFALVTFAFLAFFSTNLLAATLGTLRGAVRDPDSSEAVGGVTVLVNSATGEQRVDVTDENGRFTFADLPFGVYTVTADFAGATDQQNITIDSENPLELVLNLQMSEASVEQYTIEVTGSLLGATSRDTPIPLLGIDRADVLKRGDPTVLDQIKALPITGPVFGDANPFDAASQFRPGAGTINIRGLGAPRTLVLLNGRRFSANNATPPDTNLLPAAVIGRVEILKDGGAATYGSDAIAGVANFFTRQDIDGLELSADYRLVPGSVGDVNASAAFGHLWDGGNFVLSAGYQYRGPLNPTERSWAIQPYTSNPASYSPFDNPGLWVIVGNIGAGPQPIGAALDANCTQLGGTPSFSGNSPLCNFNYAPFYELVTEQHQGQIYGEFNTKVGTSSKLHLDGLYAITKQIDGLTPGSFPLTNGPTGPGSRFFVPATNPGFANFLTQTGNGALAPAALGASAALWSPFRIGGNPTGNPSKYFGNRSSSTNDVIRVSGELAGDTGILDLHHRLSATYLIEEQHLNVPDILIGRLQAALNGLGGPNCTGTTPGQNGCQYFNPFSNAVASNPVTGEKNPGFVAGNDPALVNWMTDNSRDLRLKTDFGVVDGIIDGRIPLKLPGGEPLWALGAQYRRTNFWVDVENPLFNALATPCPIPGDSSCAVRTGPYVFMGQYTPTSIQQDVYALFGQVDIPLFDQWKSSFGLRFEDYRGGTGATVNPQFRTKWQMFDFLALRGSIGTSFRGPTANNTYDGTIATNLTQITSTGGNFRPNDIIGNPNIKAEDAFTFNVGSIFQLAGITATVDYWFYKINNQITVVPAELIATAVAGPGSGTQLVNCNSPLASRIRFDNNNTCINGTTTGANISRVRSDTVNGPSVQTTGVDLELDYRLNELLGGTLDLGGVASVVIDYRQNEFVLDGVTIADAYDAVGYTNYNRLPGTMPRWRGQFFVNYNHGWHNVRVTTNYVDGARDNRGSQAIQTGPTGAITPASVCTVANVEAKTATNCQLTTFGNELPGFVSLDVTYQLSLPWDMVVSVSGMNLIGMDPPAARLPFGYDPFIGNPLGRTFKFAVTQKF